MKIGILIGAFCLISMVAGCKSGSSAEAKATCEAALSNYERCVAEVLGPEMAEMAKQKRDVDACVNSKETVKGYTVCNKKASDCEAFMDCTMKIAMGEVPTE